MRNLPVLLLLLSACSRTEAPAPKAAATPVVAPVAAPVAAPAAPVSPEYLASVASMKEKRAAIKALLDAGKLGEVHAVAEGLIDLANALPGQAAGLSAEARGTVALKSLDIKEQADTLHDKADGGDAAGASAAFAAVSADVDALAAVGQ